MPDGFLCGDRFQGTAGIQQPANFDNASLRAKDLARRSSDALVVLRYSSPRSRSHCWKFDWRTPGAAYCSTDDFYFFVVSNSREPARYCGHRDFTGIKSTNHESSVGKYCSTCGDSISLFDEFYAFIAHQEDSMAQYSL